MEEEIGLGFVRVKVVRVGRVGGPDLGRDLIDAARGDLERAEVLEADLIDRCAHRRIVAEVRVHEEQSLPASRGAPCRELAQRGEKRLMEQRERAGHFAVWPAETV